MICFNPLQLGIICGFTYLIGRTVELIIQRKLQNRKGEIKE